MKINQDTIKKIDTFKNSDILSTFLVKNTKESGIDLDRFKTKEHESKGLDNIANSIDNLSEKLDPQEIGDNKTFIVKGVKGDRGDKGDSIKGDPFVYEDFTDEQLESLKGKDGKDYILTDKDKKEIASKIKVPVVKEKVIERTEVITEKQITSKQIIQKIKELPREEKLGISDIKGLQTEINNIKSLNQSSLDEINKLLNSIIIPFGGVSSDGGGGTSTSFVDEEVVGGSGTSWTLANSPVLGSVKLFANGQLLRVTAGDYTISGQSITTALSWVAGTLLADYRI